MGKQKPNNRNNTKSNRKGKRVNGKGRAPQAFLNDDLLFDERYDITQEKIEAKMNNGGPIDANAKIGRASCRERV